MQWVDEDEQDESFEDDYAANFGGFGEDGGLGNIDFSKLGGGADDDSGDAGEDGESSVCCDWRCANKFLLADAFCRMRIFPSWKAIPRSPPRTRRLKRSLLKFRSELLKSSLTFPSYYHFVSGSPSSD